MFTVGDDQALPTRIAAAGPMRNLTKREYHFLDELVSVSA
jgi:hypothetical protein